MPDLAHQRCFNHRSREAAARCPVCQRYFCRECITEHEDRVLCAACLRRLLRPSSKKPSRLGGFISLSQFLLGLVLLWLCFYCLGQVLLSLPTSFHEGTVWQSEWGRDK
jgi:hypothetical protein